MKKLIIKPNALSALNNIKDIGFTKTRSFSDYHLASGEQKLDLSLVKDKKIKKLFVDFLSQCNSTRNRTLCRYMYGDYVELRILHGFGYSWSQDVENEFISWLLTTYNVNPKSKTYTNIVYNRSFLNF